MSFCPAGANLFGSGSAGLGSQSGAAVGLLEHAHRECGALLYASGELLAATGFL
jgi:hypothetical protein